jgi:hypothetical protein
MTDIQQQQQRNPLLFSFSTSLLHLLTSCWCSAAKLLTNVPASCSQTISLQADAAGSARTTDTPQHTEILLLPLLLCLQAADPDVLV